MTNRGTRRRAIAVLLVAAVASLAALPSARAAPETAFPSPPRPDLPLPIIRSVEAPTNVQVPVAAEAPPRFLALAPEDAPPPPPLPPTSPAPEPRAPAPTPRLPASPSVGTPSPAVPPMPLSPPPGAGPQSAAPPASPSVLQGATGLPQPRTPAALRPVPFVPGEGPAPDIRPRPEEPPPPGAAVPDWDLDWRSRAAGLGPPLPPPDPFDVRDIRWRHDERIVSLDARRKPVKRVPQWVDVIERDDLVAWRPYGLGDFARWMPNVMIADGGNPSLAMPFIRGLGRERTKIMTDGVWPASQALGYHGGTLSLWDPESTERVEIYHGPGVYLKGVDAPGGMINIVPRRPRRHARLSADTNFSASYLSSSNLWRGRAEADVGQDRVAALVGATWTTLGDRQTADGTLEPSSYDQLNLDLAADYFLDNRSRIGITAQYAGNQNVQSPSSTGSDLTDPAFERIFIALTLSSFDTGTIFSGTRASIALDTFFKEEDESFVGFAGVGLGTQDDTTRFDAHLEGNLYIHPCHETWAELTVSYAHMNRTETILSDGSICDAVPLPDVDDPATGKIRSIASRFADIGCGSGVLRKYEAEEILVTFLVEDQYHTEAWDIYSGVRLDFYHAEDNQVDQKETDFLVGGAVGIARHFTDNITGFANASLGWRRPSLYERTATVVVDGATLFGNPNLDPELNVNVEAGVKSSWRNRASFQTAVFAHYMDDFIGPVALSGGIGDEQELENRGDVWLIGTEVSAAIRPLTTLEGLELFGSAGFTVSNDQDLVRSVPLLWRGGARYSVPQPRGYVVRRWFGELAAYGATEAKDGRRGGPAYQTADLVFGLGVDGGDFHGVEVGLGIQNLFDIEYVPPASVLPAAGLGVFASVGVRF